MMLELMTDSINSFWLMTFFGFIRLGNIPVHAYVVGTPRFIQHRCNGQIKR
jgi:hypothetical protein